MRSVIAAATLAFIVALPSLRLSAFADGPAGRAGQSGQYAYSSLVVETQKGEHLFRVELASSESQRSRGLMFRQSLPSDAGMLFDFGDERPVAMWMKDTPVSLDMIFISGNGLVVGVAENTVPFSTAVIRSPAPARAVLEVNAGTAEGLGIGVGSRVRHNVFQAKK
ncbi:MAG: DUF192 domain-containing protein [Rhodospirillales bacterium]|nr:DUF192 domain-containing protein [Rhodospirillales bacterium]MCW8952300.1 DUF192 domain-containing protein [Rhodospirillales bacterium]